MITPFINAYREGVIDTVVSQVISAQIAIAPLFSPDIYYVLSGDDFSLDINDPEAPKIFCLGGSQIRQDALSPVLSLYIDRLNKQINKKGKHPCAIICDEFASVRAASVMDTMAQARENDIVTVIGIQDLSQLKIRYTNHEADQLINMAGNLMCGQVGGDTARLVSDRFRMTKQSKTTITSKTMETTVSKSSQLAPSVLPSTIANLSSGEFLGIVSDDPEIPLELKGFHAKIVNDRKALKKENKSLVGLPVVKLATRKLVKETFINIKANISHIVDSELHRILNDSSLAGYVVKKGIKRS